MSTIDLGNGQTVQRRNLPKNMVRAFDEATTTFIQAQANVRAWVQQLIPMQAPADRVKLARPMPSEKSVARCWFTNAT